MAIAKTKSKMISFRLSNDEYDVIRSICQSNGVRSISDFARLALQNLIAAGGVDSNTVVSSRIEELSTRVEVLDLAVGRLAQLVQTNGHGRE